MPVLSFAMPRHTPRSNRAPIPAVGINELELSLRIDRAILKIVEDMSGMLDRGEVEMAKRETAALLTLQRDIVARRENCLVRTKVAAGIAM